MFSYTITNRLLENEFHRASSNILSVAFWSFGIRSLPARIQSSRRVETRTESLLVSSIRWVYSQLTNIANASGEASSTSRSRVWLSPLNAALKYGEWKQIKFLCTTKVPTTSFKSFTFMVTMACDLLYSIYTLTLNASSGAQGKRTGNLTVCFFLVLPWTFSISKMLHLGDWIFNWWEGWKIEEIQI